MQKHLLITIPLAGVMALSMSCDEALPPYQDPRNVLEGIFRAQYILLMDDNSLHVRVVINNAYDETLQGPALMQGTVHITSKSDLSIEKTLQYSAANIVHHTAYNRTTGILTIDPKDSLVFEASWNFIDNAGGDVRQRLFQYVPDPSCGFRSIALEETFVLRGSFKVFERTSEVNVGPTEYSFCHITSWVPAASCPIIYSEPPCGYRR
jgi:hypothetical protein